MALAGLRQEQHDIRAAHRVEDSMELAVSVRLREK